MLDAEEGLATRTTAEEAANPQENTETSKITSEEDSASNPTKNEEESTSEGPKKEGRNVPEPRFMQRSPPQKAHEYDFIAARTHAISPNTMCESIAHMIKVFLVGGVFAMHVAFSRVGIPTGIVSLVLVALIVGYSMCSLVKSAQKMYGRVHLPRLSYPDLAEATMLLSPWKGLRRMSKCFRYTLEIILMVQLLCTCAVFQIIISRALKQLFEGSIADIYGGDYDTQKIYIMGTIPPCLLVVMVRHLRNLAPFAVVIDLFANMAALVTIYYGLHGEIKLGSVPTVKSLDGLFQFLGMCLFSLQAISVVLVIENNMEKPKKFPYVIIGSLPYAVSIIIIIGVFGYWGFGEAVIAPITVHFPWTHFPIMTKVFLCIVVYIIYAEVFYFGFDIQWFYLKRFYKIPTWWYWERLYRAINVVLIACIAFMFPSVSKTMGLLGCCFVSILCLILPAFIELVIDWEYPGPGVVHWRVFKFLGILLVGLTIFGAGTFYNLKHLTVTFSLFGRWTLFTEWM